MPNPTRRKPEATARRRQAPFEVGGVTVAPGERRTIDLPISLLSNHTPLTVPIQVVHGRRGGPRLFVSAAIHGDELNGVEIIRRLLALPLLARLRGTLLAVPIVNVYGFIAHTRYLPDRRDLNRSFPGSPRGSLSAQLANLFMTEVVQRCSHGIDLHTGSLHRTNLPQIRADLANPEAKRLALAFGAPVVLNSALRDGSLRQAAGDLGVPMLLYEGGEALRFDELAIRAGVSGVVRLLHALGMIARGTAERSSAAPVLARSSYWVRAPAGGVLRTPHGLGVHVADGDRLGTIAHPLGESEFEVIARDGGILIGRTNLPVVNQGDGLFHIARVRDVAAAVERLDSFQDDIEQEPLFESGDPD